MLLHSYALSWFWANQYLLSPYCHILIREATNTNFILFDLTPPELELMIYCTYGEHTKKKHYTTVSPFIVLTISFVFVFLQDFLWLNDLLILAAHQQTDWFTDTFIIVFFPGFSLTDWFTDTGYTPAESLSGDTLQDLVETLDFYNFLDMEQCMMSADWNISKFQEYFV